jgi:hypothetical protein
MIDQGLPSKNTGITCLSNLRKSHCLSSLTDGAIVEEWATGHWDLSFVMVNGWKTAFQNAIIPILY